MFGEERAHVQLVLHVARQYYEAGLEQREIAEEIGYSRPTVSRLLTEARDRGIVRFTISHPVEQAMEHEEAIRQRFGVSEAAVASSGAGAQAVGRLAAGLIAERGGPRSILALSNGTSVGAVVEQMPERHWPYSCVTQMVGSLGEADRLMVDSAELCRRLATRLGGTHRPLPAPIVMSSAVAARSIRREQMVLTTLELAARADIALCGVGAVGPQGSSSGAILSQHLGPRVVQELRRGGAVGHISGHHFDARGRHVTTSLCERLITMDPERLARIETSMVAAWGAAKVPALHGLLQTEFVSCLVTDEPTAQQLLAYRP